MLADLAHNFVFKHRGIWISGAFIGAIDGTILWRERPIDDHWQHTNYNGKVCMPASKQLYVQLFDGTITAALVNFVGLMHDAKMCSILRLHEAMQHLPADFVVAADSAFGTSARIVHSLTETEYQSLSPADSARYAECANVLSVLRVTSEWAVGGPREVFQVLSNKVASDDLDVGWIIWEVCSRMMNVRVRKMGKGQTYNTFCQE